MSEVEYGNTIKKICFDSTDALHAELKIRLHYDEIKIKDFFNEVVKAYVGRNEHMLAMVNEIKANKISAIKRNKAKRMREKEVENINKFGLNKKDIESIFDILEKEHPDL